MKLQEMILETERVPKEAILEWAKELKSKVKLSKKKKNKFREYDIEYYNIVCAFDIETTSIYDNEEAKGATMYVWQFGIHGKVYCGRTWEELREFLLELKEILETDSRKRLVVYIHNESFEFQWLSGQFLITETFSLGLRNVIRAMLPEFGIEIRCSYALSGCALSKIDLIDFDIKKQSGEEFDYIKLRGSNTPLTEDEYRYCIYDVLVVMAYVYECIKYEDTNIANIRMTKTGMVRNYMRRLTIYNRISGDNYKKLMERLTIEPEEYLVLKRAFAGGITHASATKSMVNFEEDVESRDLSSSYPTCLCSEKYPCTKGKKSKKDNFTFEEIMDMKKDDYCAIFDVEFTNLIPKFHYEHIISESKSEIKGDYRIDNGRVARADYLKTTITNVDLETISWFYDWDEIKISNLWFYRVNYLPKQLLYGILKLYEEKTELKDIEEQKYNYNAKKSMLNSVYGDFVMDPIRDIFTFNDEVQDWNLPETPDINSSIYEYNTNQNRYNFYPWGVFCTSYARANLCKGIIAQGKAYIYADTDSLKLIKKYMNNDFFDAYNKEITEKIDKCLKYRNLNTEMARPKNKNGEPKQLGIWDFDGSYKKFKTLGAKRYMYACEPKMKENGEYKNPKIIGEDGLEWHITVAGLNKSKGAEYLASNENPLSAFDMGLTIGSEYSGRLTSYYFDQKVEGKFIDYLGNEQIYKEEKSICFIPSTFSMKPQTTYMAFCNLIQKGKF